MRLGILLTFILCSPLQEPPTARRDLHGDPLPPDAAVRLGRMEFRHSKWIYGLAVSADGKTIATGSPDHSIRIWDPATGRLRRLIDTGWIMSLAMTPDGRTVASAASHQGRIRFHDVETGRELRSIEIKDVTSMKFSPDGSLIAATGPGSEVRTWRVATGELVHSFEGFTGRATGIAFADGGRRLVAGSYDKELRAWDVASGKEINRVPLDRTPLGVVSVADSPVVAVSFLTADDGFLGPGKPEGLAANVLKLIDSGTGETVQTLEGHEHVVYAVALSQDGKRCAAADAGEKRIIRVWDVATGKEIHQLTGHARRVTKLAFMPDGRLVSGSEDWTLRFWDLENGRDVTPRPKESGSPVWDLAWSPDSTTVATANDTGNVHLWEASTGRETGRLRGHVGPAKAVAFSPDGSRLATGGDDRRVKIWDVKAREEVRALDPMAGAVLSLQFDPTGKSLFVGGRGFVGKWNVATGQELFRVPLDDRLIRLRCSPDGRTLVMTEYEYRVRMFDAENGRELLSFQRSGGPGVAFLPNRPHAVAWMIHSQRLARLESAEPWSSHRHDDKPLQITFEYDKDDPFLVGSRPSGLAAWSVGIKKEFRHNDIGSTWQGLDASADGRWIAVGMFDGTLRLFETITFKEIRQFRWHHWATFTLAFSPDGTRIASSCASEPFALIWNVFPEASYRKEDAERLWRSLGGGPAGEAFQALTSFKQGGSDAIHFLTERLKFSPEMIDRAEGLVSRLDSEDLEAREGAHKELREMGIAALPSIRKASDAGPKGETRIRLDLLIDELEGPDLRNEDAVRRLRAVHIFDMMDTQAARLVLESISKNSPSLRERREAALSLQKSRRPK